MPKSYLDAAIADAQLLAVSGAFGSPASVPAIQDYLADEILEHGFHTYLGRVFATGDLGAYIGAAATGDFDGNLSMEEVFGEADYDCGKGRVIVENAADNKTYWSLDNAGVLGSDTCKNYLGAAVAVGDFDGDGCDDLAMSTPGEPTSSQAAAGAVHILYGSTSGLSATGDQVFNLDTVGIGGVSAAWDYFAEVLTTGDFNCDGYDDLAVGTPRKTIDGVEEAGSVHVLQRLLLGSGDHRYSLLGRQRWRSTGPREYQ